MKKISFLFLMMLSSMAFAQNAPITFETGAYGNAWTWTTFENGTANPAITMVANPSTTGINTSATVCKFTATAAGQPWAGYESSHGAGIGTFTLSAANCVVKMMVYKSVISDVGIKFATSTNGSSGEIKVANTVINQWEELTFNFASKIGETNDQIIIFPDFQARTTDNITYVDNITFSAGAGSADPTTAAPTPTAAASDVISMFSNAYTNVGVDTWRTSWSNATLTDIQIAGNDTKKYTSLDYVGIETTGPNLINAANMTKFHVNAYTPNMTTFRVKLVDFGADAAYGGGDDKEHELVYTPTQNAWNSYDINLSDFTGLTTTGHIAQLIFSGLPAGTGTLYVDNVYFSKPAVVATEPTTAAPAPTKPSADVISMFSNAYTNVGVDTWRTSWSNATLTDMQVAGDDVKKYSALDFVGIESTGANLINAANMTTFHVDAWTPNMTLFRIKLVDFGADAAFGGGDDKEHELTFTPIIAGWNSFDIPLTDFTGLTTTGHIAQLIFSGNPAGTGTIFIDNVYFSKPATILEPTVAAPTPTALASNVISLFSNAYTNVGVDTWRTSWSNATLTDVQVAGNDVKKYSALDFVGIETTGANLINASTMSHFNLDIWTPNMTTFRVKLVDFGADAAYGGGDDTEHELTFTPTQNGWVTLNIPMTDFTNLTNKSHIAQLIFSGLPTAAGIVYIDNVYFSKPAVGINNVNATNLNVYPNPTVNSVSIKGLNANEINIAKIYTIDGRLIATQNVNVNGTVDLSNLTNGTYLVKVNEKVARVVKY